MLATRCSLVLTVLLSACAQGPQVQPAGAALPAPPADDPWPSYNRTLDGQRYSPLAQITPGNVARLKPVCEFGMGVRRIKGKLAHLTALDPVLGSTLASRLTAVS